MIITALAPQPPLGELPAYKLPDAMESAILQAVSYDVLTGVTAGTRVLGVRIIDKDNNTIVEAWDTTGGFGNNISVTVSAAAFGQPDVSTSAAFLLIGLPLLSIGSGWTIQPVVSNGKATDFYSSMRVSLIV